MNEAEAGRDTVSIDESVHEIYKQLTEGNDPLNAPFRTMKDVFMWAMVLGYLRRERRPLTGKRVVIFRLAQFSPQLDVPLLKALALADREAVSILHNQEGMLESAEEFANAGINELRNKILMGYGQPIWNMVSLVFSSSKHSDHTGDDL